MFSMLHADIENNVTVMEVAWGQGYDSSALKTLCRATKTLADYLTIETTCAYMANEHCHEHGRCRWALV